MKVVVLPHGFSSRWAPAVGRSCPLDVAWGTALPPRRGPLPQAAAARWRWRATAKCARRQWRGPAESHIFGCGRASRPLDACAAGSVSHASGRGHMCVAPDGLSMPRAWDGLAAGNDATRRGAASRAPRRILRREDARRCRGPGDPSTRTTLWPEKKGVPGDSRMCVRAVAHRCCRSSLFAA